MDGQLWAFCLLYIGGLAEAQNKDHLLLPLVQLKGDNTPGIRRGN